VKVDINKMKTGGAFAAAAFAAAISESMLLAGNSDNKQTVANVNMAPRVTSQAQLL
jgi:cyanophycinase-like exopeptidase